MRHPFPPTWIVVMDSSVARFYALHYGQDNRRSIQPVADAMHSDLHAHARDVVTDKPGRDKRSSGALQHHSFETPQDYHKLEKHDFVVDVAQFLKGQLDRNRFQRLVMVAPARSIGEFRNVAGETLKKAVWHEIGKDLVKLDERELWQRLEPELHEDVSEG